ncbi:hypothetical protein [Pseudoalteromonas ruthenica]|uniref:Uncharacterized protein n=1 Tax=Pseudoalteromonas ruthenica TaxID=151081 RepID=A0A0F4PYG8_9GAMM|nr:hypothetical protein [Pseudoalteromonas ruthenica]KJY95674.1 hypothetical protein TW76_13900 [Pseudoalteromonas ruthenica]KJZ00438.1 hypothetical protein TW72_07045 [Pseudoalteromonas ruthenica]TMO87255.1 hypothetical protein CWC12_11050 [Pseudoalteromonas ruthenica]TMO94384.1 hypothetical protein CWC13_03175 [Pseudoalteromonas ruthenica]TMP01147.1 hypothetical protein CWC07_02180 [Pseudoalteromonas ruthenica]
MKTLLALLFVFFLSACDQSSTYEPTRPDDVPASSLWIGGPDGGVYAEIREDDGDYSGTIYFDSTGEIWYEGAFEYTGKEPFEVDNKASYTAWDGTILYLSNGKQLVSNIE